MSIYWAGSGVSMGTSDHQSVSNILSLIITLIANHWLLSQRLSFLPVIIFPWPLLVQIQWRSLDTNPLCTFMTLGLVQRLILSQWLSFLPVIIFPWPPLVHIQRCSLDTNPLCPFMTLGIVQRLILSQWLSFLPVIIFPWPPLVHIQRRSLDSFRRHWGEWIRPH